MLLNIYLITLLISWECSLFYTLTEWGVAGGDIEGSGMNTGCHYVALCL